MDRKSASDFDPQLLSLFNKYVHGAINRREFLDGAAKFAIGGLTAMGLWEMLRPNSLNFRRIWRLHLYPGQPRSRRRGGVSTGCRHPPRSWRAAPMPPPRFPRAGRRGGHAPSPGNAGSPSMI